MRGLPKQLTNFLAKEYPNWIHKGQITGDMVWKHESGESYGKRYMPETVGRALRSLEEESVIAAKYEVKGVQYKWIPHELRSRYIPSSQRMQGKENVLFKNNEQIGRKL